MSSTIHEIFSAYGGPEAALDRFVELSNREAPPLSADDRLERDLLGAAFSELRSVMARYESQLQSND